MKNNDARLCLFCLILTCILFGQINLFGMIQVKIVHSTDNFQHKAPRIKKSKSRQRLKRSPSMNVLDISDRAEIDDDSIKDFEKVKQILRYITNRKKPIDLTINLSLSHLKIFRRFHEKRFFEMIKISRSLRTITIINGPLHLENKNFTKKLIDAAQEKEQMSVVFINPLKSNARFIKKQISRLERNNDPATFQIKITKRRNRVDCQAVATDIKTKKTVTINCFFLKEKLLNMFAKTYFIEEKDLIQKHFCFYDYEIVNKVKRINHIKILGDEHGKSLDDLPRNLRYLTCINLNHHFLLEKLYNFPEKLKFLVLKNKTNISLQQKIHTSTIVTNYIPGLKILII